MPEPTALEERIAALLREELGLDAPSAHADLLETGVLDSLTLVELILRLEETFGLRIAMERVELSHFRSIATIASFVVQGAQQS